MSSAVPPAASAASGGATKNKGTVVSARSSPTPGQVTGPKSAHDNLGDALQQMEDVKRSERKTAKAQRKATNVAAARLAQKQARAEALGRAAGKGKGGKIEEPELVTATPPATAPSSPVPHAEAVQQLFGGKQRGGAKAVTAN